MCNAVHFCVKAVYFPWYKTVYVHCYDAEGALLKGFSASVSAAGISIVTASCHTSEEHTLIDTLLVSTGFLSLSGETVILNSCKLICVDNQSIWRRSRCLSDDLSFAKVYPVHG